MHQELILKAVQNRKKCVVPEDKAIPSEVARERRKFLTTAVGVIGVAGATLASWPFLASLRPSARAKALGAPVRVDLRKLQPDQQMTVEWQRQPIWVLRRGRDMLDRLSQVPLLDQLVDPDSTVESQQPAYARNATRSIRPEFLVTTAICTHLGCVPIFRPETVQGDLGKNWLGGYYCPCHKSKFDFAGRVFKAVPAPTNLVIPPHRYLDESTIEIGVDDESL